MKIIIYGVGLLKLFGGFKLLCICLFFTMSLKVRHFFRAQTLLTDLAETLYCTRFSVSKFEYKFFRVVTHIFLKYKQLFTLKNS